MDKKIFNIKKFIALFLALSLSLAGCSKDGSLLQNSTSKNQEKNASNVQTKSGEDLEVHFIDVGQGSSTLIESSGCYMLVDGGDSKYTSKVVSYLDSQSVDKLDYIIATHYDADHLNGVVGALDNYDADIVIAPDYKAESKIYNSFTSLLKEKGIKITYPETGAKYKIGDAEFTILAPNDTHYDDANDYSVAIKLVNGNNSFILTGDAEIESEYEMLETGIDLSCDVYLAGHHGSKYSSSQAFLQALEPDSVVISAGKDNRYGHPSEETMARLNAAGCDIYRTDKLGDIIAISDGKNIEFNVNKSSGGNGKKGNSAGKNNIKGKGAYIGNINSKKFHEKDCGSVPDEENRVYFNTADDAEDAGYNACGNCNPE
ncbi:MAG: MBL fold metallo-hydrolase [Lachnospiraceae bacterium]|nr:MBL fold metallo-hydrolase [Lachnospiraceae bacterium]